MNIVFAGDENYARNVSAAMMSLVHTHPHVSLNFHILDAGMSEASRERLRGMQGKRLNVHLYDVRKVQAFAGHLNSRSGFTTATFSRFFIPELLVGEERALYLDADVIVLRSLDELYHSDMKGKAILMVQDMVMAGAGCRRLGVPRYFNAGVMLLDLVRCRRAKFPRRWQEYLHNSTHPLPFLDQDVINIVSQQEIGELPPCYNYLFAFHPFTHDDTAVRAANEQAAVLHFVDRNKPWLPTDTVHPFEEIYLQTMLSTPWAADVPVLRRRKMWRRLRCCLFCRMRYEDVRRGNVKTLRVLGIPLFTRCRTSVRCTFYLLGVPVFTMKYHRRSDDSFP